MGLRAGERILPERHRAMALGRSLVRSVVSAPCRAQRPPNSRSSVEAPFYTDQGPAASPVKLVVPRSGRYAERVDVDCSLNSPAMPSADAILARLRSVPYRLARSATIRGRLGRFCLAWGLLCGQIGLPEFSAVPPVASADDVHPPEVIPQQTCPCPPAARKVGRCCCAVKPVAKSCCSSQKHASAPATCHVQAASRSVTTPKPPTDRLVIGAACPCGDGAEHLALRCADPRVLPAAPMLTGELGFAERSGVWHAELCGELLPPPLPPPRVALG